MSDDEMKVDTQHSTGQYRRSNFRSLNCTKPVRLERQCYCNITLHCHNNHDPNAEVKGRIESHACNLTRHNLKHYKVMKKIT